MRSVKGRPIVLGLLEAAAVVTALFSVATLADSLHRYLELFSHFRLQYLIASLLLCLIFIAFRSRLWASLMLVVTAINVLPVGALYVADTPRPDNIDTDIKLLQANIWAGNSDASMLIDLIRAEEPDIIILQEVTDLWIDAMDFLETDYPYRVALPRNDAFGIAIFARTPLLEAETLYSPPLGYPSLIVRQSLPDGVVTFVSTHPIPPLGQSGFDARNEQLVSISEVIASISGPTVLVGDLNTTMWGHHYEQFEESTGLVNVRDGFGVLPTWPTQLPFAMIPIDHCLVSGEFAVVDVRAGPDIGSDHLPLLVTLALLER